MSNITIKDLKSEKHLNEKLKKEININKINREIFERACVMGYEETVDIFIKNNLKIKQEDLLYACSGENMKIIKKISEKLYDLKQVGKEALKFAVLLERKDIIDFLINKKIEINGSGAIIEAVKNKNKKLLEKLLKNENKTEELENAIAYISIIERKDKEYIKYLENQLYLKKREKEFLIINFD